MRKTFGIVIFLLTLLPLMGFGDAFFIKAQNRNVSGLLETYV